MKSEHIQQFKLCPVYKDYLWGGTKLSTEWNKGTKGQKIAESWELSLVPNAECTCLNKRSIKELFEESPEIFGDKVFDYKHFPMLIKLIDAHADLSVQVHPNDAYALQREEQYGKIETWYILDANEDSYILCGFKKRTTREELEQAIKQGTVVELLNKIPVKAGDCLTVPPGTVHSIMKGITLYEIQQNSNITYRIYDYDRIDGSGNRRALHIKEAEEIINFDAFIPEFKHGYIGEDVGRFRSLEKTAYYSLDKYEFKGKFSLTKSKSFMAITVIAGEVLINGVETYQKGETAFIAAGVTAILESLEAKILVAYL